MSEEEMFNILKKCYVITTEHCLDEDNINLKQAIQKIVSLYQSQKEKIQYLEENDYAWHQLLQTANQREYRSKFLKDFQKEYGENVLPDYDEIYKRYDKMKRMIELMAEHLTTDTHGKDWVIKYFEDEVELENDK